MFLKLYFFIVTYIIIYIFTFRAALPSWILANIVAQRVVRYGSYFLGLCGALQILACFLWVVIRNPIELKIPFANDELTTHFGVNFWMTLAVGKL